MMVGDFGSLIFGSCMNLDLLFVFSNLSGRWFSSSLRGVFFQGLCWMDERYVHMQ
jgi:hypothetical protein